MFADPTTRLPDVDPVQTSEWMDSIAEVAKTQGHVRARYLASKLLEHARSLGVQLPPS